VGRLPAKAGARTVLIDPKQPKRVYAAGDTGLYRSDDAGETWQATSTGLPGGGVIALALDPRQPQRLYAATPVGALYLSEDGATSWRALSSTASNATP
jgi:photosystem II stability/assembly factor-like uncharacterized protein